MLWKHSKECIVLRECRNVFHKINSTETYFVKTFAYPDREEGVSGAACCQGVKVAWMGEICVSVVQSAIPIQYFK